MGSQVLSIVEIVPFIRNDFLSVSPLNGQELFAQKDSFGLPHGRALQAHGHKQAVRAALSLQDFGRPKQTTELL
jgi:hypothetical protein